MNHIIIVESPAKAKTLKRFLGAKYNVKASMGHIRDLPKKDLGIDTEKSFEPTYEITPDKKKIVKELKALVHKYDDTMVWLASDEDREGESIAWHLMHALKLKKKQFKRIAFHEITKPAILKALENPRDINIDLVDAQQARRVLDRLVGYKLSPLLWKKIRTGLSAGRVQSVAVRIIVEREKEIDAFKAEEYWKIDTDLKGLKGKFNAELSKISGKKAKVNNAKSANQIEKDLNKADYEIIDLAKRKSQRQPAAPFITSTLQQEAARKLGFSVKQTMMIAQQLYEGITHGKHHAGLITYMRTDAFNLSKEFLKEVPKVIKKTFGKEYMLKVPRTFNKKTKGAQEAHEAIRPTHINKTPAELKSHLDNAQYKLYKLIWERTIACQMPAAELDITTATISANKYTLTAKGQVIRFAGFMKAYIEGTDHPEEALSNKEKLLPELTKGETCKLEKVNTEQKFTLPPPRYTEASLVKKLESEGIGRPSTYAPTISTIINRGYVEKSEAKKLVPTDLGKLVNEFLVKYFPNIVDYKFTANLEEELDSIANGKQDWRPIIKKFYDPFKKTLIDSEKNAERVTGERKLGNDPKTKKPIIARMGRYGAMVQMGEFNDENEKVEKPKFAKLLPNQTLSTVTLEQALELFKLPRELGEYKKAEVVTAIGRFGPFVRYGNKFVSIPKNSELDPYTIKLEEAIVLIKKKEEDEANKIIANYNYGKIQILNGRYGPYIRANKRNYKIPKDKDPHKLTLEECEEIIENAPEKKKFFRKKK